MQSALLSLNNICKEYNNKKVIENITFDIVAGEVISLLGVNGAGKTTLSSIIATLHPPTSGELLWRGNSLKKCLYEYRKYVGYAPQILKLNNDITVYDLLWISSQLYGLSHHASQHAIEYYAKKFHFHDYLNKKLSILSGGQRQRVIVARALLHNPEIVVLDEPTVGIDVHARQILWGIIKDLKKDGKSVILTSHYLDEVETLSDKVILIHRGTIVKIASPQEITQSYNSKNLEEAFVNLIKMLETE